MVRVKKIDEELIFGDDGDHVITNNSHYKCSNPIVYAREENSG